MSSHDSSTEEPRRFDGLLPRGQRPGQARSAEVDEPRPVDQVAIRKLGGFNFISPTQWSVLSREERARLIKGDLVIFLYEGERVPTKPALLYFRSLTRAQSAGEAVTEEPGPATMQKPLRFDPSKHRPSEA